MSKKFRMGRVIKKTLEFWKSLARKEGNNPISPRKLEKAGCPVNYVQLRATLPRMARNGLANKLGRGNYTLKRFRSSPKKRLAVPSVIKPMSFQEAEQAKIAAKVRVEGRMTNATEEIQHLQDKVDECTAAIIRTQNTKSELEAKKRAIEDKMEKLKRVSSVIERCPDLAEVIAYLKELELF